MDPPGDPRDQFVELYVFCEDTILRLERRIRLRVVELRLSTSCHWRKPHKGGPRIMSRTTLAALLLLATTARADETVVVIVADTLRADYCTPERMPAVAALAAESTVYTDCWSTARWTLPAHGSLFTGLLPHKHGAVSRDTRLREDVPTLAEHYRAAGYRTEAVVANWAFVSAHYGLDRGFDSFEHTATWTQESAVPLIDEAIRRPGDLFMVVNLMDCHSPCGCDDYDGLDPAGKRAAYATGVRRVDDAVRSVLLALHLSGRWPRTRFVFTSDHGELLGEYGRWGHEEGLVPEVTHIPLLVRTPGQPPATVAATQTLANVPHILIGGFSAHDIALIEQRVPERVIVARRGQSFAQWLRGDVTGTAELWPYLLVEDVQTATATPDEEALKSLGYL